MSEQKRFELREELIEFIGQDKAETLMEALPPVSWDQLATKDDLNTLETVIGAEFTKVAAEFTAVGAEFTAVRGELAEQIGEVHKEIGGLHVAIAESTKQTTAQFVELSANIGGQTRTMVMWFVGIAATIATSAVALCMTLVTQL
ncbi:MAG: hypothetical protein OXN44_06905 [Acidimicrobiaceae bacterium]|nr:hypothetical protein [Acidimicrobiaceae bacterium]